MTTTDKLQRIRAKCVELLATAEKRTSGEWTIGDETNQHIEICIGDAIANLDRQNRYGLDMIFSRDEMRADGHFIAACAGNAEAAWRSTIAAIDHIIPLHAMLCEGITQDFCEKQMLAIIAAWPDELFQ